MSVQRKQFVSCKQDIKRIVWIFALPLMCLLNKTSSLTTAFFKNSTSLCFDCLLCCARTPKLKETYLQIRERNAREIRQRTREKVRALQREQELVFVEDLPVVPIVVAQQSYLIPFLVCVIIILVLVNLLLWQSIGKSKRLAWKVSSLIVTNRSQLREH